jgi:hypothetical protein
MRSSSRSKSSLKISHTNTTSATFEMAHKFQKILKKSEIFTTSTYRIPASTIKNFSMFLPFHLFDSPSEISKIAEGYVYFLEECVDIKSGISYSSDGFRGE